MAPATGLRPELRAWIEHELPLAAIPEDSVLDALLAGRGGTIFAHLVSRVVSARNAATLRAQLELSHPSRPSGTAIDAEAEEAEKFEDAADEVEAELEELRTRLCSLSEGDGSTGGRLGAEESTLRAALVRAAVENVDEGTALCGDVCEFLQARFSESKVRKHEEPLAEEDVLDAVRAVQELLDAAEEALHGDGGAQTRDVPDVQCQMAGVHAEIEFLCQARPLEDITAALQRIAEKETAPEKESGEKDEWRDGEIMEDTESPEEFAKRLMQRLQDRYLALFAESEAAGKGFEPPIAAAIADEDEQLADEDEQLVVADELVEEVQANANALCALDKTLSTLTKGNRERMALALSEARSIDTTLLKPLDGLKTAARDAQAARLEADLRALDRAQHADLAALASPTHEDTISGKVDTYRPRVAAARMQRAAENRELTAEVDALSARARRVKLTCAQVDEAAKTELLPLLERAAAAARHAAERTVPAAATEVRGAARVHAFVTARTHAGRGYSGPGHGEV